ncbi:Amidase [Penicillium occitanis (nom. inval.)]|nr:Amidase [Penicillium occitanis (nom. inval.)]PCG95762.1 hypothetical protein PENOC_076060 [Penicillium occitanis (nom. inval.)]
MPTTAGSFALLGSRPKKNAVVIDRLLDAGVIILGKANMTEFCNYNKTYPGWNSIGGQTQSAYVVGGVVKGEYKLADISEKSPGGSSTGVAVGTSASFSPIVVGTETDGSLNPPASRAALFALKVTVGAASREGIISISSTFDSLGGMGKIARDVAVLTDVLLDPGPRAKFPNGLSDFLVDGWQGIRVGFVDASLWQLPPKLLVSDDEYKKQMVFIFSSRHVGCAKIELGATVIAPVELPPPGRGSSLKLDDEAAMPITMRHEFRVLLDAYLTECVGESQVSSLEELMKWNKDHASLELPQAGQDLLVGSQEDTAPIEKVERARAAVGQIAKNGIDRALAQSGIEAIIAPTESPISSSASSAGYPIATVRLGR